MKSAPACERIEVCVTGAVQGVGFRPFVFRLADELHIAGWVTNTPEGVTIEAEGDRDALLSFLLRLQDEKPEHAAINTLRSRSLDPTGASEFRILPSSARGNATAEILPDLATCPDCLSEILDPTDRRYRYPFVNCTHCGPRFTIVEALPYDRRNTSMKSFALCPRCRAEYEDPRDRRFHAQPTACPECGPHLSLWTPSGETTARRDEALLGAAAAVRDGAIVAVKGLGGFHLIADARSASAVRLLRQRKRREEKPFAVMFPDMAAVRGACAVCDAEEALLASGAAPIVLLARTPGGTVSDEAAPGNPALGAILPYTPLHHLLMRELAFPIIATSGNLSEEPICIDERDALHRLRAVADAFLVHDRPIRRHCDDSVVRVVEGRTLILRRARGYAPAPIRLDRTPARALLAVGAHQKSTVAILAGPNAVLSQHLGDLGDRKTFDAFRGAVADVRELYPGASVEYACDLHPAYQSTQFARESGASVRTVQHHYAHVASCMAEHGLEGSVLGVAWDGTGFGDDGTIWGGEFLRTVDGGYTRCATFRTFGLPGGESAMREPRRSALGLLHEMLGDDAFDREDLATIRAFSGAERDLLRQAMRRRTLAPLTSSVGRLFDGVASLLGLRQKATYEGQAASALEFAAAPGCEPYPFAVIERGTGLRVVDWEPMLRAMLEAKEPVGIAAGRFHATLARIVVDVALRAGEERVVLTGGCFQNVELLRRTLQALRMKGFRPFWHERVPPNDGGIALGQIYACVLEDHAHQRR